MLVFILVVLLLSLSNKLSSLWLSYLLCSRLCRHRLRVFMPLYIVRAPSLCDSAWMWVYRKSQATNTSAETTTTTTTLSSSIIMITFIIIHSNTHLGRVVCYTFLLQLTASSSAELSLSKSSDAKLKLCALVSTQTLNLNQSIQICWVLEAQHK